MATLPSLQSYDASRPASESHPSVYIAPPGPEESRQPLQKLLVYVHYAYPLVLLIFFLSAFTVQSIYTSRNRNTSEAPPKKTPHYGPGGKALPIRGPNTRSNVHPDQAVELPRGQRLVFQWVSVVACLTFAGSAINTISHAVIRRDEQWWCGQATVIYIVGSFFVYALFLISLLDTKPAPTTAHLYTWTFALVLETLLLVSWLQVISGRHSVRIVQGHKIRNTASGWEAVESALYLLRILVLLSLIFFYILFIVRRDIRAKKALAKDAQHAEETTGLLAGNGAPRPNGTLNGYGSVGGGANGHGKGHGDGEPAGWSRPNTIPSRSWWEYIRGYTVLFPYLWPHKDRRLQLTVIACFGLVAAQRVINVFVPNQIGNITNVLSGDQGPVRMPWGQIFVLIVFRILQGSNGLLGAMRSMLWIPVSQYSYRELTIAAFEHVHSLSLDFHLGKKTGEVLSALGKGNSINNFLEQVTFQVAPMLVDLAVAIVYFLIAFDAYYALIVTIVTFWYMYLTIRMAQWRADIRRQMVNADRDQDAVKNDSMVSYETVKYFNAEEYEFRRYKDAVGTYQRAEFKVLSSLNLLNVSQNLVFMLGFMAVCFLMAYQVTARQRKVGDFVKIVSYMGQLQSPLNFFGTFYRVIQSAMINSERMLELFKEEPTVVDDPGARTMYSSDGDITFQDVHFNYDRRKPALDGLDFRCEPGTTTALVGESGGGKSTVFRLLFRFYNVESGSIRVDDRDVQDVTIDSLRRQIGVVPQDTVLFNETLMYNLRYANPDASDEDVYRACRAASIHDKIMGFPDGYDTKVGERGLRLSGGEKQRVAIARTILKNPRIILLDEATAALDTETEEHIQEALTTLAQGRTMLVIAHRLSTITRADQILVLHEGKVAERGTHDELLLKKGRYSMMWRKQVRAQRAAEEAKALNDKAARLRRESKTGQMPGDHGEDSQSPSEDESPQSRKGKEIPEQQRRKSSPLGKGEASEGRQDDEQERR